MAEGASAYADTTELATRWRALTPDEGAKAELYLADASRDLRRAFTDLDERAEADANLRLEVARITCNLVRRRMTAEEVEGVESDSDTQGPYARTRRYRSLTEGLTVDERRILDGRTGGIASAGLAAWSNEDPGLSWPY